MTKLTDRTGMRYERLVVIKRAPNKGKHTMWFCQCDCGNQTTVGSNDLRSGATRSCGCLRREVSADTNFLHGMTDTPEYHVWKSMRDRCNNPDATAYHNYGGRGITVDPRWNDFITFHTDMGPKPGPGYTVERIDNDGPYSPENCKWATRREQGNNSRLNHHLTFDNRTLTIAQWAREIGIHASTLYSRVGKCGWSIEKALTTPTK